MKVIIVAGPTATGKTGIAIKIAKKFNGELINADSRQVYKDLNIGTNKGNLTFDNNQYHIEGVPIHLVNILDLDKRFNLFDFQKLALAKLRELSVIGKDAIVVGGTGLYIDSLVKGYVLSSIESKDRESLESLTVNELQKMISTNVLDKLNNSDKNNSRRLIRVVEKNDNTDKVNVELGLETFILYPNYNWEKLKLKIESRVDSMFKEGLVDETKSLLSRGYSQNSNGLKIMGYKQVIEYLNNKMDLNTCIERVKIAHKQYAKRQRTWFEGKGRNYNLNKYSNSREALRFSENFLLDEI